MLKSNFRKTWNKGKKKKKDFIFIYILEELLMNKILIYLFTTVNKL